MSQRHDRLLVVFLTIITKFVMLSFAIFRYSYAYVPEDVQHRAHSLAMIMMQNIAYGAESSNRIQ